MTISRRNLIKSIAILGDGFSVPVIASVEYNTTFEPRVRLELIKIMIRLRNRTIMYTEEIVRKSRLDMNLFKKLPLIYESQNVYGWADHGNEIVQRRIMHAF